MSGSDPPLPTRFSALKKEIWRDALTQSWRDVLDELKGSIEEIASRGAEVLELAFTSAAADADILVDNTVHTILGLAKRAVDRPNLKYPESGCSDCPGRRTKRGLIFLMSHPPSIWLLLANRFPVLYRKP